jgi:polar amino acid transport system substrate-binding protein
MKPTARAISIMTLVLFAAPLLTSLQAYAADDERTWESFMNMKAGVLEGSVHDAVSKELMKPTEILYFNDPTNAFIAVLQNKSDYSPTSAITAKIILTDPRFAGLTFFEAPPEVHHDDIAAVSANRKIIDQYNDFLAEIKTNGVLDDMKSRWIDHFNSKNMTMPDIPLTPKNGALKVASESALPPFNYIGAGGELIGFEIEHMSRFAQYLGMDVEFFPMRFGAIIPFVKSGRADIGAAAFTVTEERKKSILFTEPYIEDLLAIVAKKLPESSEISNITEKTTAGGGLGLTFGVLIACLFCFLLMRKHKFASYRAVHKKLSRLAENRGGETSVISVRNLTKSYGNNVILSDINMEIKKGEVISIIGPSGTGKSTFLRALNMLDPPTSGEILFDGVSLTDKRADIDAARKKMGMVFQNFGLFSHMTVLENITAAPIKLLQKSKTEANAKAFDLLKTVGLSERAGHYPHQLSGGQKQRAAIARCLAMEPEVILFDEPTSALDPTMVGEVMAVIRKLAADGMTMIVVTHEMDFARDVSTRVVYMDGESGTAGSGLYEDASPSVIFNNPQRERTKNFIFRVKSFNYAIRSKNFDYVEMLTGIENFCFKHAVSAKIADKIRLAAEELVINIISSQFDRVDLNISFPEKGESYEITAVYGGENIDVLSDEEDLAVRMLRGIAEECSHTYADGVNTVRAVLKS